MYCETHPVARLAHAALQHGRDAQLLADLGERGVLAAKRERRVPRGHVQAIDLHERIEDVIRDPVGEVRMDVVSLMALPIPKSATSA